MTLSDLGITPEKVLEIVEFALRGSDGDDVSAGILSINTAAPEIARAVLEAAAKRFDGATEHNVVATILRQLAKEFDDAK